MRLDEKLRTVVTALDEAIEARQTSGVKTDDLETIGNELEAITIELKTVLDALNMLIEGKS